MNRNDDGSKHQQKEGVDQSRTSYPYLPTSFRWTDVHMGWGRELTRSNWGTFPSTEGQEPPN